ncbi:hypothetical protein [Citrobacter cronae]|uniref:hypothetical protein n=1 Tax=Citrobacter cronae TaxID=1748967 RepID=UPI001C102FF9|nr:hypothetical protein [Citrobacter cronae]MBU5388675.1 hypothetical protein [Citrobacter cronae]
MSKKNGAKLSGDPRKRQAEAKKLSRLLPSERYNGSFEDSGIEINNDVLSSNDLDNADELVEQFFYTFPDWKKTKSWDVQSQIIRAFDAFVMWKNEAEGSYFDLQRCFEVNKVTDVAKDIRSFLINKGLYIESEAQWNENSR